MALDTAPATPVERVSHLVFRAGVHWYSVSALSVHSIVDPRPPVPVPGTPSMVRGVVNLGGRITTVIDLEVLLRAKRGPGEHAEDTRYLVISVGDGTLVLPAEEVAGLVDVPVQALIGLPQDGLHAAVATFTDAGRFVTALDASMLLLQAETLLMGAAS